MDKARSEDQLSDTAFSQMILGTFSLYGRIWLGSKPAEGQEIDEAESQVWEILQINYGTYDASKTKLNL